MTTLNLIQIAIAASCYLAFVFIIGFNDTLREPALKILGAACVVILGIIAVFPILIFFGVIDAIAKLF